MEMEIYLKQVVRTLNIVEEEHFTTYKTIHGHQIEGNYTQQSKELNKIRGGKSTKIFYSSKSTITLLKFYLSTSKSTSLKIYSSKSKK